MPVASVVFVLTQRYRVYDGVHADVSDHLLAIVSEFGLRVFRKPTGTDSHRLAFAAD